MKKDGEKQQLLLEYLISSSDTFARCKGILRPSYFNPEFKKAVAFIIAYYDEYSATPDPATIKAETGLALQHRPVTHDQLKYCADEIEKFCQDKALEEAVLASFDLIKKGDRGKFSELIKAAMSISLDKDLGLEYYLDPLTRLEQQAVQPLRLSTGLKDLDELLNGGLARGETILLCASSGGGKSITMQNLALNYLKQGLNVLYVSLELSEELIAQRYDIMHTGIPSLLHREKYREISQKIIQASEDPNLGDFMIKRMSSGTTANQIRAYLKEYELKKTFVPDVICVDYIDLMNPNEKIDLSDVWTKDKLASEQLKDIGEDYDAIIITASQLNRGALEADTLGQQHTAGGISKVNTVDWQFAILLGPEMKAQGICSMICLKSRSSDAVGKTSNFKWDNTRLLIQDEGKEEETTSMLFKGKGSGKGLPPKSKKSLLDIME